MIFGKLILLLGFLTFLSSTVLSLFNEKSDGKAYPVAAKRLFQIGFGISVSAVLLLLSLILGHHFEYTFVYKYSSLDLPLYFLISTFWAGQAGTFLLWGFYTALFGIIILRKPNPYQHMVIAVLGSVVAFLFLLAMKVNPFEYVWFTHANQFAIGQVPTDGVGLNPLLQDFWMVIHPPILFLGYASTVVPFAFVISRLMRPTGANYVKHIQTWSLFSMLILGVGIILGGYWAYTTLGWGGYWGWDPVENSSLVPFIFIIAFVHGLFLERNRKILVRSNLFLGALPFIAMLYGSFLTRSGVLADFSVHSFIDQGINVFLVIFLVFYIFLFLLLISLNFKQFKGKEMANAVWVKETFFSYGIIVVMIFGILIFVGTSAPLITMLFADKAGNVSLEYYNIIGVVITGLVLFLIAFTPLLPWKRKSLNITGTVFRSALIGLLVTIILYMLGLNKLNSIFLIFMATFSLILSAEFLAERFRVKKLKSGGFIAHIGIGLMVIGVVSSGMYGDSKRIALPENESVDGLGYEFKYNGFKKEARGQDFAEIEVTGNDDYFIALPKFYYSDYTRSYMHTPYVRNYLTHDLYIAPLQLVPYDQLTPGTQIEMLEGETTGVKGVIITFNSLGMDRETGNSQRRESIVASALLTVKSDSIVYNLKPAIKLEAGERTLLPDSISSPVLKFTITGMQVDKKIINLIVAAPEDEHRKKGDYLVIEVSEKPFIWILWLGTIILFVGIIFALLDKRNLNVN